MLAGRILAGSSLDRRVFQDGRVFQDECHEGVAPVVQLSKRTEVQRPPARVPVPRLVIGGVLLAGGFEQRTLAVFIGQGVGVGAGGGGQALGKATHAGYLLIRKILENRSFSTSA